MSRFLIALSNLLFRLAGGHKVPLHTAPIEHYVDRVISVPSILVAAGSQDFEDPASWCPSCKVSTPDRFHKHQIKCVYCNTVKHEMAIH